VRQWENIVEISARNQIRGRVTSVSLGAVMAEVEVDVSAATVASAITASSVARLGIKVGDEVTVIIKATEVMLGK
jgi:molybdopterin-binding protein